MLRDGKIPAQFDRAAYDRAHDEISELTARLPVRAVRSLAEEVVARLAARGPIVRPSVTAPSDRTVAEFCRALVSDERDAWAEYIAEPAADGASLEQLYEAYLAAAARQFGHWWDSDEMSFTQVAVGVGRVYAIMRSIRQSDVRPRPLDDRHALFAAVPGDNHTLGVTMAADIFRASGWNIDLRLGFDHDALVDAIAETEPAIVGLSAGARRHTIALARLIVALRVTTPQAMIVVSGHLADLEPDIVGISGADFASSDIHAAMAEMGRTWEARPN